MSATISQPALRELVTEWIRQGKRVAGPRQVKPGCVLYAPLESSAQLALAGFIRPANSVKEFIFPKHEELYGYRITGNRIELIEVKQPAGEQVLIAARPCDAASMPILDHVFNWDYKDELYNLRRQLTTVVTLACTAHDDACFCTSVGLGPAAERGSDAMLLELGDGEYEVRCLTEKGKALFDGKLQASERVASVAGGARKALRGGASGGLCEGAFRQPLLAVRDAGLPRLWRLRLHLPDVPLFRYRRRGKYRERRARQELGFVPVHDVHAPRFRPQPAPRPAFAAAAAHRS